MELQEASVKESEGRWDPKGERTNDRNLLDEGSVDCWRSSKGTNGQK